MNRDLQGSSRACKVAIVRFKMLPAVRALFAQILSFIFCLLLFIFLSLGLAYSSPLYLFVFAQAAFAAFLSVLLKLNWWWCPIQFLFSICIFFFSASKIPSFYYLIAFVFFALVYWTSFRTQVPYYPSKSSLLPVILNILPMEKSINFIDIGSGLGGLLLDLSKVKKDSYFSGIEIAPLPWVISFLRGKFHKETVQFMYGDYQNIHLGTYDVVFAYLSPAAMTDLWIKAQNEMCVGSILLSYEFIIPNVEPDLSVNLNSNDPILYLWRI